MNILYFTYLLNAFLMLGMPFALALFLGRKFHLGWRLFFIGAVTFILSQVGHIPFNYGAGLILNPIFPKNLPKDYYLIFNSVFLGLSAGIFEEGARYLVLRFWAKDARSWSKALMFGAGHGGVEAIILGILVLLTYINMVAMNGANLAALGVPADQVDAVQKSVAVYWSNPWYLTLLGAVERSFAIPMQVALAVMVMQVFTRQQARWFWLAVLWHALADGLGASYLMGKLGAYSWGPYAVEGVIGLFALGSIAIILALRQPEPVEPEAAAAQAPLPLAQVVIKPVEETEEGLESTKFN